MSKLANLLAAGTFYNAQHEKSDPHIQAADRIKALETALRFYANPGMYQPHPHGLAFDRRGDLYRMAKRVVDEGE